ncbi:hypothetical protein AKJ09_05615 [Labilithrix luteola]|uniref:Uncharacterized protein n=1 Tax=Labilithrix luteola TaxID=1391654 RepID=A0A0K1PZY6_9BACT|nr:hypothetical protein [Labilithrix luteola]AKU98951.1 hypothetical protein AKJ09_05615 [Labilithrix luteola]
MFKHGRFKHGRRFASSGGGAVSGVRASAVVTSGVVTMMALAAVMSACGLDIVGSAPSSATDSLDASTEPPSPGPDGRDGSSPSKPDATSGPGGPGPCSSTSTACISGLEAGWTPVAFATSRTASCPTDYATADVVTNANVADGACSCTCETSKTDPPSCAHGTMASATGTNGTCSVSGPVPVSDTSCTSLPLPLSVNANVNAKLTAVPFYPGTCTAGINKDETKVTSSAARVCTPPPACNEDVCAGDVPSGFSACIAHEGDVACPTTGPFVKRTLAGASADLTCGGCSTCKNSASCGVATVRLYGDATCNQQIAERAADDVCGPLKFPMAGGGGPGQGARDVVSVRYDVAMVAGACSSTSSPTSDVSLAQPRTICCR